MCACDAPHVWIHAEWRSRKLRVLNLCWYRWRGRCSRPVSDPRLSAEASDSRTAALEMATYWTGGVERSPGEEPAPKLIEHAVAQDLLDFVLQRRQSHRISAPRPPRAAAASHPKV
jgi:hypothetical protein